MIVDIFKSEIFKNLEVYNQDIVETNFSFTLINKIPNATWFSPANIKLLPPVNFDSRYELILYCANYLPLFLAEVLLNKIDCIEDFGCGDGKFIYYLHCLGFNNFSVWDNWSQCPKELFENLMKIQAIRYSLNDRNKKPKLINNSMSPFVFPTQDFETRDMSELELVTIYQNRDWQKNNVVNILEPKGFTYLCSDPNDFAKAYCKVEKYKEFKQKLEPYDTTI